MGKIKLLLLLLLFVLNVCPTVLTSYPQPQHELQTTIMDSQNK